MAPRTQLDLRGTYGREANGENAAGYRRNLHDPGSCDVPGNQTLTLAEWQAQQDVDLCEGCEERPATHSLVILNSQSAANVGFGCWPCTSKALDAWGADPGDVDGFEVRRLTTGRPQATDRGEGSPE